MPSVPRHTNDYHDVILKACLNATTCNMSTPHLSICRRHNLQHVNATTCNMSVNATMVGDYFDQGYKGWRHSIFG